MFTSAKAFFEPFTMGFSFNGKRVSDAAGDLYVSLFLIGTGSIVLAFPVYAFIVLS